MGPADTAATKRFFGFPEDKSFYVPEEALANWRKAIDRGKALESEWNQLFERYRAQYPDLAAQFERTQKNIRKEGWEKAIPSFPAGKPMATRNAGGTVMNAIADAVPELFGGAADLTSSTKTIFKPGANFHVDPAGRNVFFGVREFAMCAAVNGMAAHGGPGSVRIDVLLFLGLLQAGHSPGGIVARALAVHLYARLDWPGRGRSDPSAHRAPDDAARGARPHRLPPRGRQ